MILNNFRWNGFGYPLATLPFLGTECYWHGLSSCRFVVCMLSFLYRSEFSCLVGFKCIFCVFYLDVWLSSSGGGKVTLPNLQLLQHTQHLITLLSIILGWYKEIPSVLFTSSLLLFIHHECAKGRCARKCLLCNSAIILLRGHQSNQSRTSGENRDFQIPPPPCVRG